MTTVTTTSTWYVPHRRAAQTVILVSHHRSDANAPRHFPSQLEDLEVTVADHIQKVLKPNFGAAWEEVGDEFEKEETFALASVRTLDGMFTTPGVQACGSSGEVF